MNATVGTASCSNINVNNSVCSVFVELDYRKGLVSGRLGNEQCINDRTLYVQTEVATRPSLVSTIRYTCAQNNCDSEFISSFFPLTTNPDYQTWTAKDITQFISSSASPVFRSNCTIATKNNSEMFCRAHLTIENSGSPNTTINNCTATPCSELSSNDNLLSIRQWCSSSDTTTTEVTLRYDADDCTIGDPESLGERISQYFETPLDCSTLDLELNCTQATSAALLSKSLPSVFTLLLVFFVPTRR